MLGTIVAIVVCAVGGRPAAAQVIVGAAAEWEDVPAPGRAGATAAPRPTAISTANANATPASPAPPDVDSDAPPLPAAPAGPPLADVAPLLLSRVARPGGHAIERLIEASGDVVEHEVNAAGTVQSCRTVGSIHTMAVLAQQPTAGGEYLQVARDVSGALVQFVVSRDGEPRAVVVAPAP